MKLPKLKWITSKLHRAFDGKIKNATISLIPSGKYFVSILVEEKMKQLEHNNNVIAFDLWIKEFLIDTNNNHIENPKTLNKHLLSIAKSQRKLAHKKLGSKNCHKQRVKIAGQYDKIANTRKDFLHKLSKKIIDEN